MANKSSIESLDRAIGDDDYYINIKCGSAEIAAMVNELLPLQPNEVRQKMVVKLLSTLGGASGPLFAYLLFGMSKLNHSKHHTNKANLHLTAAAAFAFGVQAIESRGKANIGEKTMLDVLMPVSTTYTLAAAKGKSITDICYVVQNATDNGLESTRNLLAPKGHAAGLHESAIGQLNPGAESCQVMINTICGFLLKNN